MDVERMDTNQDTLGQDMSWNNNNKKDSNVVTLCEKEDTMRRTLARMDRSGSTESVATTSGVESSGSEPGSPSRPATPMPPLPTHHHPPYDECIRAHDSEDSGLGPSPAKSVLGGRPGSPVSPIQFGSRCSDDSLLDLSPRTDNSYESEDNPKTDDAFYDGEDEDDLENDAPKSPPFKFLLSNNKDLRQFQSLSNSPMSTDEEDVQHFKTLEDPFRCGTTTSQPTKFPSPLVVTNFRCSGPTTNDDHGFRLCSPKDASETFFDERARQQEDNSDKLKDILLKKHISQQNVVSSEVPEKLDDIFVNNYLNQQQICGELPTTNQTDKLNDPQVTKQQNVDSLTGHLQPECCDGVPSSNNQTDELENHFLQNHLNRQLSNSGVSLNSQTDKSSNHSTQNHLNQQQISDDVSNNRTDKLNSHVLQNHLNQQLPSNDELCATNRTDKLSNHITQKLSNHRRSCSEQSSTNETDKLNSNFPHNHQSSGDIPSTNQTSDNFLQNHLNKQQKSEAELPTTDHFPASSPADKQSDHHSFLQDHRRLNPKVVLIRSNLCGNYVEESSSSSSSRQSNSSHCSQSVTAPATSSLDDGACKWLHCERSADANTKTTDLVDHIRQCHVREQSEEDGKSFVCLWVGCKVYDRPSSSRTWLERHVLLHGGSKPFRCIVDGCRQRFGSELVLERHVNSHFPQRTRGSALGQHCRKKNRHKHRKRPTSNKSKDFIDDATMEHVRHNLFLLSSVEGMDGPSSAITFHSNVIGRKMDNFGKVHLLLHWSPEDMLPDSWIPASEMPSNLEKTIPVSRLPPSALQLPSMAPLAKTCFSQRPAKRKRK